MSKVSWWNFHLGQFLFKTVESPQPHTIIYVLSLFTFCLFWIYLASHFKNKFTLDPMGITGIPWDSIRSRCNSFNGNSIWTKLCLLWNYAIHTTFVIQFCHIYHSNFRVKNKYFLFISKNCCLPSAGKNAFLFVPF